MVGVILGIILGIIVLIIAVILLVDKTRHRDEIRYNYKAKHFGVVKKKTRKKMTSVFMTTKDKTGEKSTIPMERNADPNDTDPSYFIKRVRAYDKRSYGIRQISFSLTKKDRETANQLYKQHQKNAREMKRKQQGKKRK